MVYEQVCVAALDCNQPTIFTVSVLACSPNSAVEASHHFYCCVFSLEVLKLTPRPHPTTLNTNLPLLPQQCYEPLEKRFGKESVRVGLLDGQRLEAEGKFDEAAAKYAALLKVEPTSAATHKRSVSIAAAKGDIPLAIKKMNDYLDKFAADPEAWTEMASLTLKDSRFESAKFCFEELILTNPYNHLFHQRYAEVRRRARTRAHSLASASTRLSNPCSICCGSVLLAVLFFGRAYHSPWVAGL